MTDKDVETLNKQSTEEKVTFHELIYDLNTELYQELEDKYNCSGMCRTGLFFFNEPIS